MQIQRPLETGYAEPRERAPKVAQLDDFDGDPQGFPHGQAVESVLLSHSKLTPEDVQRMQNEPPQVNLRKLFESHKMDFLTGFRTMTARNLAGFYRSTTQNLRTILREQPTVKVINQSQGETTARQLESTFHGLKGSDAYRAQVGESLGLGADAPLAKICTELLNAADAIATKDPLVQQFRAEYLKAARDVQQAGITYLVAAGNQGAFARELEALGVEPSPSAFRNIFVCDYVTVVGANDAEGNLSSLNSPHAGIEARALGEDLAWEGEGQSGVNSGTSFATPIVAGQVVEMEGTPFSIEARLQGLDSYLVTSGSSVPTANGQTLTADGHLEAYILERIGEGFLHDLAGEDAGQLATASQESTFFGLPGTKDHEFQLVRMGPDPDGRRTLEIDTWFSEGHHVLRARAKDGAWDPASFEEELHLDKAREKEILARPEA